MTTVFSKRFCAIVVLINLACSGCELIAADCFFEPF